VNYSVGGSATEGTDYTGTTTHSITIAAGQTSGTITVDPTADSTFENDETVVVTLTGGSTNSQAISLGTDTATGTITNDDGGDNTPPTITLIDSKQNNQGNGSSLYLVFSETMNYSFFDLARNHWRLNYRNRNLRAGHHRRDHLSRGVHSSDYQGGQQWLYLRRYGSKRCISRLS
jgi:hypothetical protein